MKEISEAVVDDILRLKYGKVVEDGNHTAYATNATLGKIFKVSSSRIQKLCSQRFEKNTLK